MDAAWIKIVLIISSSLFLLWLFLYLVPVGLYLTAYVMGVRITIFDFILMRFRKVPPNKIVRVMIYAKRFSIQMNLDELEAMYLAGVNIEKVISAIIEAKKQGLEISFFDACQLSREKKDILTELEKRA